MEVCTAHAPQSLTWLYFLKGRISLVGVEWDKQILLLSEILFSRDTSSPPSKCVLKTNPKIKLDTHYSVNDISTEIYVY